MKKINKEIVIDTIPIRDKDTYKNKMGRILCVGGTHEKGGAIIMSGLAALYSGAGLVTVATDQVNRTSLHTHAPEIMFIDMYESDNLIEAVKEKDVIVIGPGLGLTEKSREVLKTVLQSASGEQYLIIDADAITLLAEGKVKRETNGHCIFTPHLGEWQRLIGLNKNKLTVESNQQAQKDLQSIVVLKGSPTQVYVDSDVFENTTGNPSQATGGMGDTLTGILAGFIGQIPNVKQAILSAVFIHSYIADQLAETHYVTLPTQVIRELPKVMRNFADAK
ncbi:NAD(P)H-hydrate dehydratase [Ruoffia tabacinasalis]|uniref:ADP-dependent (S)-NAD(P)H-hydrate dehydratase n=1 Tax=Ruoffia tabacinasalis TaxID=87458 RepID=A0ABS0LLJ7_9LACT|nr:NAD(P)H-hydrate dehydratase [Ruoffia tabacinasalis]MBG9979160.1 NAD(P)H-hydrate dehydratase [Ruoffia tabacinasalis]